MKKLKTDNFDNTFIQKWGAALFLVLMIVLNCIFTNNFLSFRTLWLLVVQAFPIAVVGLGMTFVIASGGIDISVGATMALTGTVLAALMVSGIPLFYCILAALAIGLLVGGGKRICNSQIRCSAYCYDAGYNAGDKGFCTGSNIRKTGSIFLYAFK